VNTGGLGNADSLGNNGSLGNNDSLIKTRALAACVAVFLASGSLAPWARAQDIVVSEIRIPTHDAGKKGLEAVIVRPNDNAAHPLALLTHGTPREATDRPEMTPLRFIPQAREFARRGWTAVVVMRRGFGDSGGGYAEENQVCGRFPDFVGPTKESVKDLLAATAYLDTRPEVDPSRMIAIGVSTGGLAMVGLAAAPPPGLIAAINFAGGRGSRAPDEVCHPEELIRAFGIFGSHAKVPMLWIYSANDHFFSPFLAQHFYAAFTDAGGKATFIAAPPFGEDGHHLFSQRGIPVWTPMVDEFLKGQNAVLRDSLLQIPVPAVEAPAYLSGKNNQEFQNYLLSAPHKAFAASPAGEVGVSVGRRMTEEAEKQALKDCKKAAPKNAPCSVIMIDDKKDDQRAAR
jgi:dienelactone hydrolase